MFQYSTTLLLVLAFAFNVDCKTDETRQPEQTKLKVTSGIGISAWGLIILIVSLILLGVAAYYIALFYPIICKKERKYNRIELAPV